MFVRGGSIIPILLHDGCMSLLPCMMNSIRLEIFLDKNGQAAGALYIDDGESYDYQNESGNGYVETKFTYESGKLTSA